MTQSLDGAALRTLMEGVCRHIVANADVLSEADRAIGDGDHGIGMRRGFEAALEALNTQNLQTPEQVMKTMGAAIMAKTGGAAGAVFGTLFRSGAKALEGKAHLDAAGFAAFLEAALDGVVKRGGVVQGQKTMVDALAPAAAAVKAASGGSLGQALDAAATAAQQGVESTKAMVATTGKARSLGERSLGFVDPGAVSISLIFNAMRDGASGN
jgi:phosphoenolpyruvate---glycerone phosphotransferase subunit DhaL